jgi:hypothetical protein
VEEKIVIGTAQPTGLSAAWLVMRASRPLRSRAGDPARPWPAVLHRRGWPAGRSLVDLGCRTQVVHSDQRNLHTRQGQS